MQVSLQNERFVEVGRFATFTWFSDDLLEVRYCAYHNGPIWRLAHAQGYSLNEYGIHTTEAVYTE